MNASMLYFITTLIPTANTGNLKCLLLPLRYYAGRMTSIRTSVRHSDFRATGEKLSVHDASALAKSPSGGGVVSLWMLLLLPESKA